MSARNRELIGLVPPSVLVAAGFAAIFIQRENKLSNVSLAYGAIFLALCLAAHVVLRRTLPYADPYLLPIAATLSGFGLVMIYRINETLARQQAVVRRRLVRVRAHDSLASRRHRMPTSG